MLVGNIGAVGGGGGGGGLTAYHGLAPCQPQCQPKCYCGDRDRTADELFCSFGGEDRIADPESRLFVCLFCLLRFSRDSKQVGAYFRRLRRVLRAIFGGNTVCFFVKTFLTWREAFLNLRTAQ